MMAKLHIETRVLDVPTKMGIFCLRSEGTRTGSGAMKNSTMRKRIANMHARMMKMITAGFDHWIEVSKELDGVDMPFKTTCRTTFVVAHAQKYQRRIDL